VTPRATLQQVIVAIDDRLREEARRFKLAFSCPSCVEFDPETRRCSLGFPNEEHLEASLEGRREIVFCKAFELW
jgi:hypothetical protein